MWSQGRQDSNPEIFDSKALILNRYLELASNTDEGTDMITCLMCARKKKEAFPNVFPLNPRVLVLFTQFLHGCLFMMVLLAFEDREAARGWAEPKDRGKTLGIQFRRSAGQLAENERK